MSYTIVYSRQFIRTTKGIVPLVLLGCNNVTTVGLSGKERRVRSWELFPTPDFLELPDKEAVQKTIDFFNGETPRDCYKQSGKWKNWKSEIQLMKNGCKKAMTMEEICQVDSYLLLNCKLIIYPNDIYSPTREEHSAKLCSTKELEEWISQAKARKNELLNAEKCDAYYGISFSGYEDCPLPFLEGGNTKQKH